MATGPEVELDRKTSPRLPLRGGSDTLQSNVLSHDIISGYEETHGSFTRPVLTYSFSSSSTLSNNDDDDDYSTAETVTFKSWQIEEKGAITIVLTEKTPLSSPTEAAHPVVAVVHSPLCSPRPAPRPPQRGSSSEQQQQQLQPQPSSWAHQALLQTRALTRPQQTLLHSRPAIRFVDRDPEELKNSVAVPMYFAQSFTGGLNMLAPCAASAQGRHSQKITTTASTTTLEKEEGEKEQREKPSHPRQLDVEGQLQQLGRALAHNYRGTWIVVLVAIICGGGIMALIIWQALRA